jgi:hypothetical protein
MMKTKKIFSEKAQGACKRGTAAMLCIILALLLAAVSCDKPCEKQNIVGKWRDIPDRFFEFTITDNEIHDTCIVPLPEPESTLISKYQWIAPDIIQIDRPWWINDSLGRTTKNKIIWLDNNTIIIEGYYLSLLASSISEAVDVKLEKIN